MLRIFRNFHAVRIMGSGTNFGKPINDSRLPTDRRVSKSSTAKPATSNRKHPSLITRAIGSPAVIPAARLGVERGLRQGLRGRLWQASELRLVAALACALDQNRP